MYKILLTALMIVFAFGLPACGPLLFGNDASSEEPCGFVQNVYGQRISWKGSVPIILKIHQSVPREMINGIYEAADVWNQALGKRVFEITDTNLSGPVLPRKDTQNVIYWSYAWDGTNAEEQARTNIYWIGDEMKEADIAINAESNTFYYGKSTSNKDIDLISVMVHEFGHVLGLAHHDSAKSVMATYLNPVSERRELTKYDKDSIRCEYK